MHRNKGPLMSYTVFKSILYKEPVKSLDAVLFGFLPSLNWFSLDVNYLLTAFIPF